MLKIPLLVSLGHHGGRRKVASSRPPFSTPLRSLGEPDPETPFLVPIEHAPPLFVRIREDKISLKISPAPLRVASARRRVGAAGARPRLRRWCASFSSPRSRRADPRLAPTKNNRRQRRGPAKRQRRGSAADAKSPLRLLLMGRVEPPDCHDQEPFKELKIPHLNLKKTQTVGVLYWLHCLKGIAKR